MLTHRAPRPPTRPEAELRLQWLPWQQETERARPSEDTVLLGQVGAQDFITRMPPGLAVETGAKAHGWQAPCTVHPASPGACQHRRHSPLWSSWELDVGIPKSLPLRVGGPFPPGACGPGESCPPDHAPP